MGDARRGSFLFYRVVPAIASATPADAFPHKAMAHLLASKFSAIETALAAIIERTTQRLSWQQIRTPLSLDIEDVAGRAMGRMAFYRSLVAASDRPSR